MASTTGCHLRHDPLCALCKIWFPSLPAATQRFCPDESISQLLNIGVWADYWKVRRTRHAHFLYKALLLAILLATPFLAGLYVVQHVEASSLAVMTQTCAVQGFVEKGDFWNSCHLV